MIFFNFVSKYSPLNIIRMINAIDLAKLRNAEFLQFGTSLSGLVVANNPVALNIEPPYLAFKAKLDETSELFKMDRVSPLTQELILIDERRDKAITGLTGLVNAYGYHFDAATVQAANLLISNLNLYGSGVARMNTQAETATLNSIIGDWEIKTDLKAAVTKLGITAWVAELKTANNLYQQKFVARTQEYGAANPETLRAKRDETITTYYELRKFINAYEVIQPGAAITKLINELNALIEQYNTLLKTRATEPPQTPETAAQ